MATFKPFTYTEIVAGHMYMVLAYGAIICLLTEARRREFIRSARPVDLSDSSQWIFIPALLIDLALAMRRKQWRPFATAIAIATPIGRSLIAESPHSASCVRRSLGKKRSRCRCTPAILTGDFSGYDQSVARVVSGRCGRSSSLSLWVVP